MGEAEIGPHYPDPPAVAPGLVITGFAVRERMAPRIVERRNGTEDAFIAAFHQDTVVDADGSHPGPLAMVWSAGAPQRYGVASGDWLHSWLHARGEALDAAFLAEGVPRDRPLVACDPARLEHILRLLHQECTGVEAADPEVLLALIRLLARVLGRHHRTVGEGRIAEELVRLRFRLEREPGRAWTIADMAAACGWSSAHFTRQFTTAFGMPPMECLIRMRLRRARHLLADHRRGIAEVAAEVGYPELAYFSRLFRARFGVSPSATRQLRGADNSPPRSA